MESDKIDVTLNQKLTGHKGSIYGLTTDHEHKFLLSGGGDGWVVQWLLDNPDTGKLVAEVKDQIFCLVHSYLHTTILAGTFSGNLYFIDPTEGGHTSNKTFHKDGVYDLLIFDDILYSAGGDGKLGIWNLREREIVESIQVSHKRLRGLSLSPDQEILAIASSDNNIYLLHRTSGKLIDIIDQAHDNSVFSLVFSHDGQRLFSGGRDAHLKVWNVLQDHNLDADLNAHWYTINSLDLHPNGRWLATGSRDKTVRIWNTHDLSLIKSLDAAKDQGHINSVNNIRWSKDGHKLFTASDDRSIIIWNLVT